MASNVEFFDDRAVIHINPELFSLDAVLAAAYLMIERAYVVIDGDIDTELLVELRPKGKEKPKQLALEFSNEVISTQIYLTESAKNTKITEAIVTEALMGLQPERADETEPED